MHTNTLDDQLKGISDFSELTGLGASTIRGKIITGEIEKPFFLDDNPNSKALWTLKYMKDYVSQRITCFLLREAMIEAGVNVQNFVPPDGDIHYLNLKSADFQMNIKKGNRGSIKEAGAWAVLDMNSPRPLALFGVVDSEVVHEWRGEPQMTEIEHSESMQQFAAMKEKFAHSSDPLIVNVEVALYYFVIITYLIAY